MIEKKTIKSYCMKDQLPELMKLLEETDSENEYYEKFKKRFIDKEKKQYDIDNSSLVSILHEFEEYYISVFYERISRGKARKNLRLQLRKILKKYRLTMWFLEKDIKKLFNKEGYHYLGNTTSGFLGPYIWEKNEKVIYQIEIPCGVVELPVYFMHGYVMNSWLDYISLGSTGTGGWVKKHGLYCNYNLYKDILDKPNFTISFLKHEAQHNLDIQNKQYSMNSTVLEYRAKLAELVYYPNLDLLEKFLLHAKNDSRLSHPQAQFWVITDLSNRIFDKDYVNDIKDWEPKLKEIQQHCSKLLTSYNRCKKSRILGSIHYFIRTRFG